MIHNAEVGRQLDVGGIETNYHDLGEGFPVVMIHGSGPGVSGWANWRLNLGPLSRASRVLVPDVVGFGYTKSPHNWNFGLELWIDHLFGFVNRLGLDRVDIVGNSFGGALALAIATRYPRRVRKLVLMGSVGVPFRLTAGLDAVWGYSPSLENMRQLLSIFAFDQRFRTEELAELRYRASIRAGVHERYVRMFSPGPRQKYVDALITPESALRKLTNPTLVIHGRDDKVIPVTNAYTLSEQIPNAQLHVFPNCGHWTQIEWAESFNDLVGEFLSAP